MKKPINLLLVLFGIGFTGSTFSSTDSGTAHLIINNTTTAGGIGVKTNLGTSTWCTKEEALYDKACNSLSLGNNEMQVIQKGSDGKLVNQIGFQNTESTSYDNAGTDSELKNFVPGEHLFNLDRFRNAADQITKLTPPLPLGSYGTITFEQFIQNVAKAQPMYGIVRVKVPLLKNEPVKTQTHMTNQHQESDGDGSHGSDNSTKNKYRMCGEKPTDKCPYCGPEDPNIGTRIIPGGQVCGINIDEKAQVLVYGSLFFDFVDCNTQKPIPLSDMPENPRDIYFMVDVPINVNPANLDTQSMTWSNISDIPLILGNNRCPSGSPCSLPVTNSIPFSLVTQETKNQFFYETGKLLDQSLFNSLSQAEQYQLIFPSGYVTGWKKGFDSLGITPSYWRSLGFDTPGEAAFTSDNIRSDAFEDIPVYMYTGGLVDMHHHVNISGLIYVPQAIEMEQVGIYLKTKDTQQSKCSRDKDGDMHHDDDGSPCDLSDGHADKDDAMSQKSDKDCCGGKDDGTNGNTIFIPAKQYINGAVMVRDSFFIQAVKQGGISIINNDPNTYSQILLSSSIPRSPVPFEPVGDDSPLLPPGSTIPPANGGTPGQGNNGDPGTPGNGGNGEGSTGKQKVNPGSQWIEIHPQ